MTNIAGALICAGILSCGWIMQVIYQLTPCPLCIFQRVAYLLMGTSFLLGFFATHLTTRLLNSAFTLCIGAIGASLAGRQVWLQGLPEDQVPACGADLNFLLDTFPLLETIQIVLNGTGDCAEVQWQFLGFSIAGWSFILFVGLCGMAIYIGIQALSGQTKTAHKSCN